MDPTAAFLGVAIGLAVVFRFGKYCGSEAMRRSVVKVMALSLTEECPCGLYRTKKTLW